MIDGEKASPLQFKYQVSIQVQYKHLCGGGIISERLILSAAHCVTDTQGRFKRVLFTVVAGTTRLTATGRDVIKAKVRKIYVPVEYQPVNPHPDTPYREIGDIAVIEVTYQTYQTVL